MKRLYFLLSVIVMFSLDIFSMEESSTSPKRKRSSDKEITQSNKERKLESVSILEKEENEQFAEEFASGILEMALIERLKELEEQGLPQQREEIEILKDMVKLLEHEIKIENKEGEISFVLYDRN